MSAYIIRRLLIGLLIIWGVYTLTFLAVNLAPGDPFTAKESAKVDEEALDRLRHEWGYDLPIWRRYFLHLRRMFWSDPDVQDSEGGGLAFEVFEQGGQNVVKAVIQQPPTEIVLVPSKNSVSDWGSREVRLTRQPDGSYDTQEMIEGKYIFGIRRLAVADAGSSLDSGGVLITYRKTGQAEGSRAKKGDVTAVPSLAGVPDEVRLDPAAADGEIVTLTANGDGSYGPVPIPAGRYVFAGGKADVQSPGEVLGTGGLTFDLGTSIQHNEPVVSYLTPRLWNTLKLGFWAIVVNFMVGISLGVFSAIKKDSLLDHGSMVGAFFFYSMPSFWLAVMLQLVFAVWLGWLPLHGMGDGTLLSSLKHFVMPVFVLGIASAAGTARYQRSAVLEVLGQDYVRTARAKGLGERQVIWKHVMRNSLLPVITLFGLSLPFLVSGAVLTETVFSWPGIGTAAISAIHSRGVFVLTAITLMATAMVVLGNLVSDVLYAIVDPRVRLR